MERARTLCRAMQSPGVPEVLSVLGDEADERYPIYRTATPPDGAATLCTALFDLDKRQLRVYSDHPVREPKCHIVLDLRREGP
jgi:hypothetical protein